MIPLDVSAQVADRMRAIRKRRRITVDRLAGGLTKNGYSVSRSVLSNYENGRFHTVPADLVAAAMKFFDMGYSAFMSGPLCGACGDLPPHGFVCRTCGYAENEDGTLVKC